MVNVQLRSASEADLDFIVSAEQDSASAPFILGWLRDRHLAALSDSDLRCLIIVGPLGDVGFVLLAGVANPNRAIEFRRLVIVDKGRGYGRAAVRAVLRMVFREFGAHRIWLDVKVHNARARYLYESEGFVLEGILRECLLRPDGDYDSLAVMSVLSSEFHPA